MRVTIPTSGSRGDVQPYVALGAGLRGSGWDVCLATHADFEPLVRGHELDFFPLLGSGQSLQASETGDRMLQSGGNPFTFLREFARLRRPLVADLMHNCRLACRDADLILLSNTELFIGQAVAEKLRLPTVWASLQPTTPTRYRPNFLFPEKPPWLHDGGAYNLLTHWVAGEALWQLMRPAVNRARHEVLGLPPAPFVGPARQFLSPPLSLDGYSPLVVPPASDWNARHHVTGYWFLDDGARWQPPADLAAFLAGGPPPVYVGFGSMHNRDAKEVTQLVLEALALAGQRGVLLLGWGGLRPVRGCDCAFPLESVPHDWLFPRVAAVVHHGGAGTTAAGLRAGVPSLVIPYMSDQPFWGRRVRELGVGPEPIPRKELTAERLAEGIRRAVTDPDMRRRAAALGGGIRAEDGVGRAVELLHRYARGRAARRPRPVAAGAV
jgi:UDP:flavonoid glycosyltransferase YjiC (YdhE family)